eukprot:TRINITY_DN54707_c0_g1_i1.p1 TRINITY_DN54707_c0_g1~~TRINITY_DN54707_c0_g1_i1.p1  ORF type:complete len:192 (+),score=40.84 TRINITY_DN54707_c0_g1_i1:80-655(+)
MTQVARGAAWRVSGATVPYQPSKYNLPQFHHKVNEANLPGIGNSVVMRSLDQEGQALYRWRRRVRMFYGYKKSLQQSKKNLYNVEWTGELKELLCEHLSHKRLVLEEEMSLLSDTYGKEAVAEVLNPIKAETSEATPARATYEHKTRPVMPMQYRHRPERDVDVTYLKPGGQQAFKLSFFAGKGTATQLTD